MIDSVIVAANDIMYAVENVVGRSHHLMYIDDPRTIFVCRNSLVNKVLNDRPHDVYECFCSLTKDAYDNGLISLRYDSVLLSPSNGVLSFRVCDDYNDRVYQVSVGSRFNHPVYFKVDAHRV